MDAFTGHDPSMTTDQPQHDLERADLLASLGRHRGFLARTVRGLTDEQAARRTTASELCLGGIVKHVTLTEQRWTEFIVHGPGAMASVGPAAFQAHVDSFRMGERDTIAGLLEHYQDVARHTDDIVSTVPSLDAGQPLPQAPWFEPGAQWSARRVFLHIIAETAQHAGHADIIRESLDGAKTMG
jgi:uncharacterized damage-inducible protein DinB